MRHILVLAFLIVVVSSWVLPSAGQIRLPDPDWDHPDRDLDDGFGPPAPPIPFVIASYGFEGCAAQGWTRHDIRNKGRFFHVDDALFLPGGPPITGTKSLWCGRRDSILGPNCHYVSPPGYGNGWDQRWTTKDCLSVTGAVTVSFQARWDMEADYDYAMVEYRFCSGPTTGEWVPVNGTIGSPRISGTGNSAGATFTFTEPLGTVHIRLRVVTDGAFSDEDGLLDTDGAIIIDELHVDDASGVVVPLEPFDDEPTGSTDADDWDGEDAAFGDHAGLVLGSNMVQEDPYVYNASCMWAFIEAPVNNFSCGHEPLPAVRKGPINEQFMENEIWSPEISFTGPLDYGTALAFDVYRDLPLDNLVTYRWRVRELLVGSDCWGPWKTNHSVYFGSEPVWHRRAFDLTPYLSPSFTISKIQVAIGVVDMYPLWNGVHGTGACHSHAPMFDNVTVSRVFNGRTHVAHSLSLFQDRFAEDGTLTGTVRMDGAEDDLLRIQVADASDDIATPGVFLHVKNLPNKSGPIISGGQQWPYVPSMSDAEWSVLQMAPTGIDHEYTVDLNDALYQPGDVVQYYISSVSKGGIWSYWSHFTGNGSEVTARQHLMEISCLPTPPPQVVERALYVDATSGLGAQPLIENSMNNLGLLWDRFDRNAPRNNLANSLGSLIKNPLLLQNYKFVLWDTGDVTSPFNDLDYQTMLAYLSQVPNARMCIMGSKAAHAIATSSFPAAVTLRTNYLTFNLITDDHKTLGLPLSPLVTGVAQEGFPGQFFAYANEGSAGKFDVVGAAGNSSVKMYYGNNPNAGAVLVQESLALAGPRVVLAGFSLYSVRDDEPNGVPDRTVLLDQVLQYLGTAGSPPTDVAPGGRDYLEQNQPNPFNPSTTIRYSLSTAGPVTLRIYDVTGAVVRALVDDAHAAAGASEATWNGRDDGGRPVASGVYFYRLQSPNLTLTRKMVLLK